MSFGTNEILSLDSVPLSLDGSGCYRDYFVPNTISIGKMNTWIIPDTCQDVVSFSGDDTVVVSGKGGHYETCYTPIVCNKSGIYKISYDYDIPVLNFYETNINYQHFGMFITTTEPPGGNMSAYPLPVEGNCNGTHIVVPGTQNNTPNTGSIEYEYRLQAGQTYYLWLPFMNCEDGVQRFFTFNNIKCEEQIEYPQANSLFVSTDGHGYLIPSNKWGYDTNSSYLSTSAKQFYNFSGYTYYGAGSVANNIFTYGVTDGGIKAWFSAIHYNITTANDGHGTITANPNTATGGTQVTLSNTPNTHYALSGYTLTGGTLTSNKFNVVGDATAKAWFSAIHYNITTANDGHGTCTCNKTTATGGQTATLGNSPATHYQFSAYSVTGGSVNGSTLTVTANTTAKAWFKAKTYSITTANDGHGTITCNKTTATGNQTATLSNSPATYYQFKNYTVTGGSVNGSTLTVTANCTAKGNFQLKSSALLYTSNTETATTALNKSFSQSIPTAFPYVAIRFDWKINSPNGVWAYNRTVAGVKTRGHYNSNKTLQPVCNITQSTSSTNAASNRAQDGVYTCFANSTNHSAYSTVAYVWHNKTTGFSALVGGTWRYKDSRSNNISTLSNFTCTNEQTASNYRRTFYVKNLRIGVFQNYADAIKTSW